LWTPYAACLASHPSYTQGYYQRTTLLPDWDEVKPSKEYTPHDEWVLGVKTATNIGEAGSVRQLAVKNR
jgi:hypothetical protein